MKRLRTWLMRLIGSLGHSHERDIQEEIAANLEMNVADNVRSGMTPDAARRAAILKMGGPAQIAESAREQRTMPLFENIARDTRFAFRQLRKNPGFTCTAMLMLGAGICSAVAIFAFVDAALIKPLPYRDPSRLVGVYEHTDHCDFCNLSYLDYLDWKKLNTVFTALEVYNHNDFRIVTPRGSESVLASRVSAGFFRVLGVTPILGRDFTAGEDAAGAPPTLLLSYATWQNRYGGRRDIVGQTVVLQDAPATIVGVLPREFHFAPAEPAEFWMPLRPENSCEKRRTCHNLYGVARLKDGVSQQTAFANTLLIAKQLEKQYPDSNRGQGANMQPLSEAIAGKIRPLLLILLTGAGLLLMIACVNVANLLLVRAEGRRREVAVRGALGASPARIGGQFATEGFLLVFMGGGIGLLASYWTMQLLRNLIPPDMLARMPYMLRLDLNARVLAFAAIVSVLAAVLFSIVPSLRLSREAMLGAIHSGASRGFSSRGVAGNSWRGLGSKLVIVELATAMVLMVGAGLLTKSFHRLMRVDVNFQHDHLAILELDGPRERYGKDEQAVAWSRRTLARVAALPGVTSVGTTSTLPVDCNCNTSWIVIPGRPDNGEHNDVLERDVSAGYLETLRAPLIRGRFFTDDEDYTKPRVLVINQALADKYFPGEDPLGKNIAFFGHPDKMMKIVGVVANLREAALDSEIRPAVYMPFNQETDSYFGLVVRTTQSEASILPALVAAAHEIDPDVAASRSGTMDTRIQTGLPAYMRRSAAWLVGGFAVLALLLGVIGIYGVIAYSVSQRTREIGVRMALGARRSAVYTMVLGEAGRLSLAGIACGVLCSLASATLISSFLFNTPPRDIATLVWVALTLGGASLVASFVPARRAASVDPATALRAE